MLISSDGFPFPQHRQALNVVLNNAGRRHEMRIVLSFFTVLYFNSVNGQIPENEQWRYVNLHTSLLNLIHGELNMMDSTGRELTDDH